MFFEYTQGVGIPPDVRRFLDAQRVGRLATADADGDPHVIPVVYALVGDAIYIAIDEKPKRSTNLKRLRNIIKNPRAALIVDRYQEEWFRLGWVLLRGAAAVLEPEARDPGEAAAAIAALRARYPQYAQHALEERPMIRVRVDRATAWGDLSSS